MIMEAVKIFEHAARGFVEGMGIDAATWILTAYIPELGTPSPIKIPTYDPDGVHYDDLISLGISGAVTVFGAVKKNLNVVAEGLAMFAGNYILSKHQLAPAVPITFAKIKAPTRFEDLIKVD